MVIKHDLKYKPVWQQLVIFGFITSISVVILFSLLSSVLAGLFHVQLANLQNTTDPASINATRWLQVISSVSLFLVPALLFSWLADPHPLHFVGMRPLQQPAYILLATVMLVSSFPLIGLLGQWNQQLHLPHALAGAEKWIRNTEADAATLTTRMLTMSTPRQLFFNLFVMAILPAIAEECFFRGILQRFFIGLTHSAGWGIFIAAVVFSAMHFEFLGFLPRVVLGVLLGMLYWYSGSLWPAIIAHFLNNGLQVVAYYIQQNHLIKDKIFDDNSVVPLSYGIISIILVLVCAYWVKRISKTRYENEFTTGPIAA